MTLKRGEEGNWLWCTMVEEMNEMIEEMKEDESMGCVLIRGGG